MLNDELITLIQENQAQAAKAGKLPDAVLQKIFEMKWFDLWVPREYGGLELSLIDGCRLLESLAYYDGSVGWTVTLCAGANMFAGFIDPVVASVLFSDEKICFGGSGRASGRAIAVAGGYRLTGRWSYATGAPHLSHFTCNAVIVDQDQPKDADEHNVIRSFFVPREQVLIEYDWNTFGLEATASHSFSMTDVFVAESQSFVLTPESAKHESKLFQYPFEPFAKLTLFVNYLGMYSRYTDLVQKNFYLRAQNVEWQKTTGKAYFKHLDVAQQLAESARKSIYDLITQSWHNLWHDRPADNVDMYAHVAIATRRDLALMRTNMLDLHIKCGIEAAQSESELNRIFRNFFTATQHALLQ